MPLDPSLPKKKAALPPLPPPSDHHWCSCGSCLFSPSWSWSLPWSQRDPFASLRLPHQRCLGRWPQWAIAGHLSPTPTLWEELFWGAFTLPVSQTQPWAWRSTGPTALIMSKMNVFLSRSFLGFSAPFPAVLGCKEREMRKCVSGWKWSWWLCRGLGFMKSWAWLPQRRHVPLLCVLGVGPS